MTNPKEVLEMFDEKCLGYSMNIYGQDSDVIRPLMCIKDDAKQFIISSQIATLTSQLKAIPEDYQKYRGFPLEKEEKAVNFERQRQRQQLQDLIKEWSELK